MPTAARRMEGAARRERHAPVISRKMADETGRASLSWSSDTRNAIDLAIDRRPDAPRQVVFDAAPRLRWAAGPVTPKLYFRVHTRRLFQRNGASAALPLTAVAPP